MQHNRTLNPSIWSRYPDLVPFENLEPYEADAIVASFEMFLQRAADREEIRRVLCEADQIRYQSQRLLQVIAGQSVLVPRTRTPAEVGGDVEWGQPEFLGLNDWEAQFHPSVRKVYELTRELLDVIEEMQP